MPAFPFTAPSKLSMYIYILHFDQAHYHARHYTGCCEHLSDRLQRHDAGNGANLTAVVKASGNSWQVAHVAQVASELSARELERHLKRRKNAARLCRFCNPRGTRRLKGTIPLDETLYRVKEST